MKKTKILFRKKNYEQGGLLKKTNYKKVRTLKDIQNDTRVDDVYKDKSTGELQWWMYLSEGLVSKWDGVGTITSDDMQYLKDTLNSGAVITEEEYWGDDDDDFAEGGVLDTCYVNYEGYHIQNTRCSNEGVDFIMLGEYRDVARGIRNKSASDWIYYNRMARLYITPKQAEVFVKEANKHFKPKVNINPFYYEIDRSFATYMLRNMPPEKPIPIDVGKQTDNPLDILKGSNIDSKRKVEQQKKRLEAREKQIPPVAQPEDFEYADGLYWWIGMVINLGGVGDYGDKKWKNRILNEHIPENEGISFFTLIHEYAHCLDYNRSIAENKTYKVPVGELELASGTNFSGQSLTKEELKYFRDRNRRGDMETTLLATHEDFFINALSSIIEAGRKGKIPVMNKIEEQAHKIEVKVGGKEYAENKRNEDRLTFMAKMQKKLDKADTPYILVKIPEQFIKFLKNSSLSHIGELQQSQLNVRISLELMDYIEPFRNVLKNTMYVNPQKNAKTLSDLKKLEVDINRLHTRQQV
jgi:hypothetical protein